MPSGFGRCVNGVLVVFLSSAIALFAEPLPQDPRDPNQTQSTQVPDVPNQSQQTDHTTNDRDAATPPVDNQLPDAPTPAQPIQQDQESSSKQQSPGSVPSGAAGAKAPTVKGAPAAQPVGAAIAPAKQRQRRSLLIKAGLIAGTCIAVGSAFALSKGSPSKPPGAP